jgi:predicted transcriptional regulator
VDRAQIVVDRALLSRVKQLARRSRKSVSAVVRDALRTYVAKAEPDTSWIGSLKAGGKKTHDWAAIEKSIARGFARESRS